VLCHAVIEAGWCCFMLLLRQGGSMSCYYRGKVVLCHAFIEVGWCCAMLLLRQSGGVSCYT
jgi:hypothetical protein